MTDAELKEKIAGIAAGYDKDILSVLGIDDRAFFSLTIRAREKYVNLTKELPLAILDLFNKAGYRKVRECIPPVLSARELDEVQIKHEKEHPEMWLVTLKGFTYTHNYIGGRSWTEYAATAQRDADVAYLNRL